jgi:glucokinase
MHVLAADVGGTHARLALIDAGPRAFRILEQHDYSSREHGSLEEIVERFVGELDTTFEAASFGVPGPVRQGRAHTSNLPWTVDQKRLEHAVGAPALVLNDLEAMAWSLAVLSGDETAVLLPGSSRAAGNRAVIAPGTGLGVAGLVWDGFEHRPFASEGGHADFAPTRDFERQLADSLAREHGHVSWERVLSGPGLVAVHHVLCTPSDTPVQTGKNCTVEQQGDDREAAPAITRGARDHECAACAASVDRFCALLGAFAGNTALTMLATGGVWIGGGIAPHILDRLRGGGFAQRFVDKGRMRELLAAIPVQVIVDPAAALKGAARAAGATAKQR